MVREIMHDTWFLSQKSEKATKEDAQIAQDLLDTLNQNYRSASIPEDLRDVAF